MLPASRLREVRVDVGAGPPEHGRQPVRRRAAGRGVERPMFLSNRYGHRLFAVAHLANGADPRTPGVVFCHPLGEEKQFSYRPYVRLARFLAEQGVSSLRFDSRGFGDSEGDLAQATIETQIEDTVDVIEHASSTLRFRRVVLFGVRMGATIAVLVAQRERRVCGLCLVSPIVDGSAYWSQVVRARRMAELALGETPRTNEALREELETTGVIEIQAQMIGLELVRQLEAVNLEEAVGDFTGRVFISALRGDETGIAEARRLAESYGPDAEPTFSAEEERDFWSQRSMYDAYVPGRFFERFHRWIDSCQ